MTRFMLSISLIAAALAGAAPGHCQAAWGTPAIDRARGNDAADAAFLDGDYEGALRAYLQLHAWTGEPNYLHNIAACYEKMGSVERAIDYFNRYLNAAPDLDAGTRAQVRRTIERLQGAHAASANAADALGDPLVAPVVAPSAPLSPPPVSQFAAAPGTSLPAPSDGAISPLPPAREPGAASAPGPVPALPEASIPGAAAVRAASVKPAHVPALTILRVAGIAEAGAGAIALGVGVYFGERARSLDRQVAQGKVFDASADRDGQRAYALQYAMYALGGALIAGSAAFFYCGYALDRDRSRVALLPSVGPGGAGGILAARF